MATSDGRSVWRQWAVISTSICTDRSRPRIKEVKTTLTVSSTKSHQVKTLGTYSNAGRVRRAVLIFCCHRIDQLWHSSRNNYTGARGSLYLYHRLFRRLASFLEESRDVQDVTRQVFQGVQQRGPQVTCVRIIVAAQQNSRAAVWLRSGFTCTAVFDV